MKTTKLKSSKINYKLFITNLVVVLLIIYFAFHSVNGERGIVSYIRLNKELKMKKRELEEVVTQRNSMEINIKNLHPKTLDIDLLDEIARRDLGLISEKEMEVFLK